MEIIIHRGTHQIGGCVTEIKTEEARIIIDMGTPLPGSKTENETGAAEEEVIALPGVTFPVAMDGEADIRIIMGIILAGLTRCCRRYRYIWERLPEIFIVFTATVLTKRKK